MNTHSRPNLVERTPIHRRSIDVQGYLRSDGLWDIVGVLRDTKAYDFSVFDRGLIPVGEALHDLECTLTVDERLRIQSVQVKMTDTPYSDCPGAAAQYDALVGLQIGSGWLDEAKRRIARDRGCTHITELLPVLATAAIQTLTGYRINRDQNFETIRSSEAFLRDRCFGFRTEGRAQKFFWPEDQLSGAEPNSAD